MDVRGCNSPPVSFVPMHLLQKKARACVSMRLRNTEHASDRGQSRAGSGISVVPPVMVHGKKMHRRIAPAVHSDA
jgi:hypothetical protein